MAHGVVGAALVVGADVLGGVAGAVGGEPALDEDGGDGQGEESSARRTGSVAVCRPGTRRRPWTPAERSRSTAASSSAGS
ncbi:hypothetical protein O1L60_34960 [Streptomyces diastatochromogenes]|nr:hypothetical protein [Streptomyces diastatochromogenes]